MTGIEESRGQYTMENQRTEIEKTYGALVEGRKTELNNIIEQVSKQAETSEK